MKPPPVICHCINVEPGTYANQVSMLAPFPQPNIDTSETNGWVCIDTCIATVIGWLWHQGVMTLNSCCGHSRHAAWVIVANQSESAMDSLGYGFHLAPSGAKAYNLDHLRRDL